MRYAVRECGGVGHRNGHGALERQHGERMEARAVGNGVEIAHHRLHGIVDRIAIGETRATGVVWDEAEGPRQRRANVRKHRPYPLDMSYQGNYQPDQRRPFAFGGVGDVYAVRGLRVLDAWLHDRNILHQGRWTRIGCE